MNNMIELSKSEGFQASLVGIQRNIEAILDGRKTAFGKDKTWTIHIEGACGELAVSKYMNLYWGGSVNTFKSDGDLCNGWEVRTRSNDDWDLIIRNNDPEDRIYILVTGLFPKYYIKGWIKGKQGKQNQFYKNYGNYGHAWFVPQNYLQPMKNLKGNYYE